MRWGILIVNVMTMPTVMVKAMVITVVMTLR